MDGFGHCFGAPSTAAWAAIAEPGTWSGAGTDRLEQLLAEEARCKVGLRRWDAAVWVIAAIRVILAGDGKR
ncbi:MAG TPA: hypothetical protein VGS97_01045 [Actinocrinis sp.]|uniref:hypothetical protein n=1 Tax=Actinocrinis sp. TaxID=1920516 RepID=UPI002DDD644C|nr:hypothetical protein [Actinocrinis sp.]HEV2342652.1 hypothetical protein [Actinocrinis sp.]